MNRSLHGPPFSACAGFLLLLLLAIPRAEAAGWPQWRGVNRDGLAIGEVAPQGLPLEMRPIWKRPCGGGFSSPVVAGGQLIYTEEEDGQEVARALRAADGAELWRKPFAESFGDEWGSGPRSTPVIDDDRVYIQSCKGEFQCRLVKDGSLVWRTHFEKDFGVEFVGTKVNEGAAIRRGHNGSALIDGERILVPVGSTNGATIACFDKRSGKLLWKSLSDETAYSSPVLATLGGVRQAVVFTADALVGLDPVSGKSLWRVPIKTNAKRHAISPVIVGDDRVVVASHSYGMICVRVEKDSGGLKATTAWWNREMKVNLSTPTRVGGALYGFGAGQDYVCVDGADGHVRWSQPGFGKGVKTDYAATLAIEDRLLILNDAGQLFLAAADPSRCQILGRSQVCGKTWSHPALSDGRLFVRDGRMLQCFVLSPEALPTAK
ncbi:MAG: PQQ-like beta-propeller repeat protein [Verrucomicrobia bacterium]|nr:PQQ-like beta-propeller repeat protein [Verrucomicrobiota bacterium]